MESFKGDTQKLKTTYNDWNQLDWIVGWNHTRKVKETVLTLA